MFKNLFILLIIHLFCSCNDAVDLEVTTSVNDKPEPERGPKMRENTVSQLEDQGYKILSDSILPATTSKSFILPLGAKTIGFEVDEDYMNLRENGAPMAIQLCSSDGASIAAVLGASSTTNSTYDGVNFEIKNLSKLDRRVVLYWR